MVYRRPLLADNPTKRMSSVRPFPAPTDGWNARDNITDMDPRDAIELINWFPAEDRVEMRNGYESHATGLGDQVETLFSYNGLVGDQLWAAAAGSIFDVSNAGAVGAAGLTGQTNARWQYTNFETPGGNFIVALNGEDTPIKFDGTSWTTTTITGSGLVATDLIGVNPFKERLFFIEKESLNFWSLPVNSIAGAATKFTLGSIAKKGGVLTEMGTWTSDGGSGIDDYAVFMTSKGEAIVYQGTDPTDATKWALIGVFEIGSPIGRRAMIKIGGELIIITVDGFQLISQALSNSRVSQRGGFSDKIRKAVREKTSLNKGNFGWESLLYSEGGMGIFNIPIKENGETEQYVVNTNTGAWARFTNQNANTWAVYNGELYFGSNLVVFKADTGRTDDGSDIVFDLETAFSYVGTRTRAKHFRMVQPIITSEGSAPGVALALNIDFGRNAPLSTPSFSGGNGSPWDISAWDVSPWGQDEDVLLDWQTVFGYGYAASLRLKISTGDVKVSLNSFNLLYELGGVI